MTASCVPPPSKGVDVCQFCYEQTGNRVFHLLLLHPVTCFALPEQLVRFTERAAAARADDECPAVAR